MRFTKRKQMKEGYWKGFRKTKTKFLWWPITIDDETRWLEIATIEYGIDYEIDYDSVCVSNNTYYYWKPFKFIDNDKQ
jgi:hypothetical protein